MDIDFKGLEAFVAVAESGTFTRSAEHLNLSQTAITHRISKLEEGLGTKLLLRSATGVTLTQVGSEILPKVKSTLSGLSGELANIRAKAATPASKRLSIACLPTIASGLLAPVLSRFAELHADAFVAVFDTSASEIIPLVEAGSVELALTITAAVKDQLSAEQLLTEDYFLICPANHPFSRKKEVKWADLRGERLIRVNSLTANRFIVDQALGTRSEAQRWAYEVQHTLTALRLVQAGVGLTVAPESALHGVDIANLAIKPLRGPRVTRTIGVIARKGTPHSALAQSFRSILKKFALELASRRGQKTRKS